MTTRIRRVTAVALGRGARGLGNGAHALMDPPRLVPDPGMM